MTEETLKTSYEWESESDYLVLDPDGWDRQNFSYSFFEELITYEEYTNRLLKSTCISK